MLRLTLTLVPHGDKSAAREIGTLEVENDLTGTEVLGNYRVRMRGNRHIDGELREVARTCSPWWLVAMALRKMLDGA